MQGTMYQNTTYKAFIAETAAKIAAQLTTQFAESRDLSLLKSDSYYIEKIATASINVASVLAKEIEYWWQTKDQSTVMFDVQDSLTSNIERCLSDISDNLEEIRDELERGHDNE